MENAQIGSGARILVVDDEQGIRQGIQRILSSQGHIVHTADSCSGAQALIEREHFDLALLDVMMPDGSGMDLIRLLHDGDPETVCVVITGYATVDLAVDAIKRGAYDFISKPFTSDRLVVSVNQGLERRRLSREAARLAAIEAQAQELARANEELEKLDKIKSQLMLKVAHELRAPTAAVQSYVQLILAGYVPQQELQPTLKRVQERLQQMLDLVGDLLELARLKQAPTKALDQVASVPVAEVLREVADLFRAQAQGKDQEFRVLITSEPMVLARREHLKQIWTNLISNAVKYTPRGGRITASLSAQDEQVVGAVEDTGIGIAPNDLPHLFEEFFRSDQAKATGEIGTGLGLSIVKQAVEMYGGHIEVESRIGKGTRFTFFLPLDKGRGGISAAP